MIDSVNNKESAFFSSDNRDLSVLIPTRNRAEDLRQTLNKMKVLNRASLSVEFVIIDNGSTDHTKSVVESFANHLPIRYLFEPRSGKNCALNYALDKAPVGEIIVFTDDDIDPDPDWLSAIVETCKRWPDHSVFGGKINVVLPHDNMPGWTKDPHIQQLGFTAHDIADHECIYDRRQFPFGPNLWVRRGIFENGRRFNETIGPRPKNRIMGSEASFLLKLHEDGYEFIYSPYSVVGHRIQPEVLTVMGIWRRAYRLGRSFPHLRGLPHEDQCKKHPLIWRLSRCMIIIRLTFGIIAAVPVFSYDERVLRIVHLLQEMGRNVEAIHVARDEDSIHL